MLTGLGMAEPAGAKFHMFHAAHARLEKTCQRLSAPLNHS